MKVRALPGSPPSDHPHRRQPVEQGLITYKGLPAPVICDYLSREDSRKVYSPGTEFNIGKIEMVANSQLDLRWLVDLDTLVVRAVDRQSRAIPPDDF